MQWLFLGVPVLALFWNTYFLLVRPVRKRRKAEAAEAAGPVPERREPYDLSRPYPKPDGSGEDDERLGTCPVCGMDDPLQLDGGLFQGDCLGWPAHATCIEWLGDWKPAPPPFRPNPELIGCVGAQNSARPVYLGGTAVTIPSPASILPGQARDRSAEIVSGLASAQQAGMITMDELRERIVGAFGYPQFTITADSDGGGTVTCDCGMCFHGMPVEVDKSMEVHRTCGQHEQRMAYLKGLG